MEVLSHELSSFNPDKLDNCFCLLSYFKNIKHGGNTELPSHKKKNPELFKIQTANDIATIAAIK